MPIKAVSTDIRPSVIISFPNKIISFFPFSVSCSFDEVAARVRKFAKIVVGFVYAEVDGPRAPFGAPDWKPLLNLRLMCLRVLMRPVPVVFLLLAFSPQLSVDVLVLVIKEMSRGRVGSVRFLVEGRCATVVRGKDYENVHLLMLLLGYPQLEHVCFWTWRDRLPE